MYVVLKEFRDSWAFEGIVAGKFPEQDAVCTSRFFFFLGDVQYPELTKLRSKKSRISLPIDCFETSVRNYHYTLSNNPEERIFHLLRGGGMNSRTVHLCRWAAIAHSVKRLATGWTVRESNPGGGEIFLTCPDRPWGPPSLLYNGHRVFPQGVKSGRGVTLTPHPLLVPLVMKEQSYTSAPPMGRMACTEPQQSYTSTPPMGRTACTEPQQSCTSTLPMEPTTITEPQYLYKGVVYLFLPRY